MGAPQSSVLSGNDFQYPARAPLQTRVEQTSGHILAQEQKFVHNLLNRRLHSEQVDACGDRSTVHIQAIPTHGAAPPDDVSASNGPFDQVRRTASDPPLLPERT